MFADFTPLILQAGSPCVDKGETNTTNNDWEDLDNMGFPLPPALGSLRNDMGAYGGNRYKSMPYMYMLEPTNIIVDNAQNKSDYVSGVDTVVISSKIVSPEDQSLDVKAVFKSSDGSLVDTIIMRDDGSIKDSLAGDGWYTAAWAAPDSEGLYTVDIRVFLKDYNEMVSLENASNFATIAPITGIEDEYETIQNKFELHQNYPNPFNLTTTISYSVSQPALTSLKVYNIAGKEVETLVNEQQAIGSYKIEFDASSLPGGMYFYNMKAGEFSEIKKLILIK